MGPTRNFAGGTERTARRRGGDCKRTWDWGLGSARIAHVLVLPGSTLSEVGTNGELTAQEIKGGLGLQKMGPGGGAHLTCGVDLGLPACALVRPVRGCSLRRGEGVVQSSRRGRWRAKRAPDCPCRWCLDDARRGPGRNAEGVEMEGLVDGGSPSTRRTGGEGERRLWNSVSRQAKLGRRRR